MDYSSIHKCLAEFADPNRKISSCRLIGLTDLSWEECQLFGNAWVSIEVERRRQLVNRLVELAEGNSELNFDRIFLICLRDPDEAVRLQAIEGLAECEASSLVEPLINLLQHDSYESVRAAAATALGRFALLAELKKLRLQLAQRVEAALLSIITQPGETVEVRRRAIEAVSPLSQPQVEKVIEEAYHSSDPRLRVSAIHAMGRNCHKRWLPPLLKELANQEVEMRCEAVKACGELEAEEAVPFLIPLLRDENPNVQVGVVAALGHIGGSQAKLVLRRLLRHPEEPVRQAAEEALRGAEFASDALSF